MKVITGVLTGLAPNREIIAPREGGIEGPYLRSSPLPRPGLLLLLERLGGSPPPPRPGERPVSQV